MSFVGVANLNENYDRTAVSAGVPAAGMGRRPSHFQEDTINGPEKKAAQEAQEDAEKQESSSEDDNLKTNQRVLKLAREYSHVSQHEYGHPFEAEKDSQLDPWSPNFSSRAWTKALLQLEQQDAEHYKPRTVGFAFRDLHVYGYGLDTDYQKSVGNIALGLAGAVKSLFGYKGRKIDILQGLDGVVHAGEMLVVLGPPGSGCSTFLKTVAGETHGFYIDDKSYINYQGIAPKQMHKDFRGEAIYTAEVDVHFPQLSVGDTLGFAAKARAPQHIPGGVSRADYARFTRDAIMAQFGISHTINTRVGNDFVRGVSGGERKRVTIAEAALSGAPLQCWDNSTRGLDSANALEFCKTLRTDTELRGSTACVAIYQSPQSAYDIFDKVLVLYEGRQIFFGRADAGRRFFENLGFWCPDRQTAPDFLTSMTSPQERITREGFEGKAPRTPDDFAAAWKASSEYAALQKEIDAYDQRYQLGGEWLERFKESRKNQQSKAQRVKSPYTLSYAGQVKLCLERGFQRLRGDPSLTFTQLYGNFIMALIIGSVFYNLQPVSSSFFSRGALLFFAVLLNAFGAALEILTLYAQRPIVEKQSRYAFYHPSAEAVASMLTDLPYKIMNAIIFNLTLYFLTNLRREPGAFFFFLLTTFTLTLVMSMLFRFIASVSRTLSQALAPTALLILGIIIYTGFAIPVPNMRGWARWINYIDPVAYGFESLMINEFAGVQFDCADMLVPQQGAYTQAPMTSKVCPTKGSTAGSNFVDGTAFLASSYQYDPANKWRNYGLLWVFVVGLGALYLLTTEFVTAKKSKGEVLLFRRGHMPAHIAKKNVTDEEAGDQRIQRLNKMDTNVSRIIEKQTAVFHWQDICYDIKIKGEHRRILDHVDGWVKPGTLTALMGVSGAGKTTLLDVLATRTTMGIISGEALVDGRQRDESFQRKTGYVQQQDLHLSTATVREALTFSAILRQPAHVPKQEKLDYVNDVIKLLDMDEYADAVVGVPGEGLNVEQRKRLTIGVELAAKPQLLLFLDEPTSGLDSQTSWAILDLLERLQKNGQAILCTIHQPSAMLFQRFDRLLFLAKGGKTVYYGDVGKNSEVLSKYFERNGASPCPVDANPAEWMLEVIGAAPGSRSDIDWPEVWKNSPEKAEVRRHLAELKEELPKKAQPATSNDDKGSYREFAAPFWEQLVLTTLRVGQQYFRTPSYIYSKVALVVFSGLFIGFSFFDVGLSQQELSNQLFAIFMIFTLAGQLMQQMMPHFVSQRELYEVRERPAKTYSWKAFLLSNIIVELTWNASMSIIMFTTWYFPIGLYRNALATNQLTEREALMFLLILNFFLWVSTFSHMMIAAIPTAESAGNIGNLLFSLSLIFCGVLAGPTTFPHFWIFMYRISPFTYFVQSIMATGLRGNKVVCAPNELLRFAAPSGQTCGDYMNLFINGVPGYAGAGGYLISNTTTQCEYCALDSTDQFLRQTNIDPTKMWFNYGITWVYVGFNIIVCIFVYWMFRVPKKTTMKKKKDE